MLKNGELSIIPHGDGALDGIRALIKDGRTTHILALEGGMQGGRPSVAIVVMSPDGQYCLLGQLSLRLFLEAADQLKAVHGDPRDDRGPNPIEIVPVLKSPPPEPPPVDRSARVVLGDAVAPGVPDTSDRGNGQQKGYVVLSDAERAKGFVRPVRDKYRHLKCGDVTTMGRALAETYARDPGFYNGTFCVTCKAHFPVGEDGEFVWYDGAFVITSDAQRLIQNPGEQKVGT